MSLFRVTFRLSYQISHTTNPITTAYTFITVLSVHWYASVIVLFFHCKKTWIYKCIFDNNDSDGDSNDAAAAAAAAAAADDDDYAKDNE